MTINETRQLGIEFEKRIQNLNPLFASINKLNTNTIYSYLNEALKQVFVSLYNANIKTESSKDQAKYLNSMLGKFIKYKELTKKEGTGSNVSYSLPSDFFSYIRSNSSVSEKLSNSGSIGDENHEEDDQPVYPGNPGDMNETLNPISTLSQSIQLTTGSIEQVSLSVTQTGSTSQSSTTSGTTSSNPSSDIAITNYRRVLNVFLRSEDFSRYINEYFNQGVVLRRPIAVLNACNDGSEEILNVQCDGYTDIKKVELYYYRYPQSMSLFNNKACELPYACFEDIVQNAVQIFAAYANYKQDTKNNNLNTEDSKR